MKHKYQFLSLLSALLLFVCAALLPVHAQGDDPDYIVTTPTETKPPQTAATSQGTVPAASQPTQPTQPTIAENGTGFSEDGILATRDLLYDKATNKQYIVVETRSGETFYMVIDYDKPLDEDEERYQTYFLNSVDTADLLAMLGTEETQPPVCSCSERCSIGRVNLECELCVLNIGKCVGAEPMPTETVPAPTEPAAQSAPKSSAGAAFVLLLILCGAGAAGYYYLIRPKLEDKSKGSTNLNEYDFGLEEDEEYADFEKSEEDAE